LDLAGAFIHRKQKAPRSFEAGRGLDLEMRERLLADETALARTTRHARNRFHALEKPRDVGDEIIQL
jgi:hypothetical protein